MESIVTNCSVFNTCQGWEWVETSWQNSADEVEGAGTLSVGMFGPGEGGRAERVFGE